jgi:hypothetical protein
MEFGVTAALQLNADRYNTAQRHIQLTSISKL